MDKPSVEVTEEEFQHEIEQLRESRATIEPVEEDRALVDGDWAQITYNGQVEGEAGSSPDRRRGRAGRDWRQRYGGGFHDALCAAPSPARN